MESVDSLLESRDTILKYFAETNINNEKLDACGTGKMEIGPIVYEACFYTVKTAAISQDAVTAFLQSAASADNDLAVLIRAVCAKEANAQQLAVFANHVSNAKTALESKIPSRQTVFRIANDDRLRCLPSESIIDYRDDGITVNTLVSTLFLSLENSASYQPVTIYIITEDRRLWESLCKSVLDEAFCRSAIQKRFDTLKRADETILEFSPETQVLRHIATPNSNSSSQENKISGNDKKPAKSSKQSQLKKKSNSRQIKVEEARPKVKVERASKLPRSRKGRIADPSKICHSCSTSHTALWRKALIGGQNVTVCNSCGIKYATKVKKAHAHDDPRPPEDERLRVENASPTVVGVDENENVKETSIQVLSVEKEP